MIRPPRLCPGDAIAMVAPAGPVPRAGFLAGCARFGVRYRVAHDEALFTRDGYLAGDDVRRVTELNAALQDRRIRAVLCARGGYGILRILPSVRLGPPKPVVGFSDITALHAACLREGVVSLHAPTVTHLAALSPEHTEAVIRCLESPEPPLPWSGLAPITPGVAGGIAVGGTIELVASLCGTPWALPFDGSVLFLEEVGERPYRIDRTLTQLELAGARRLSAVVVGELVRCLEPDGSGPSAAEVVAERVRRWGVPAVAGAPFGHGENNLPFVHGGRVEVDADRGVVRFLDGAVE
ncbi:MAG: LD-carboxypeptidase [Myxococcales bacterium]|nr:LD-carboxypeptidase [Myxococcales bacterium]